MAVNIGTAVFHRIIEEHYQAGFKLAREAAVRALRDTMKQETIRFGCFDEKYVEGCAIDRFELYAQDKNAIPTNQYLKFN